MPTFVLLPSVRSHLRHKPTNDYTFTVPYSEHSSFSELIEFVSWLQPREILPTVVQSYKSLKKHLLPHVPGAHLGDFSCFRVSAPKRRWQHSVEEPEAAQQTQEFVPTTIDEYQALYPWTVNVGLGNKIQPSLYRSSTLEEEDLERAAGVPSPARASSVPLLRSPVALPSPSHEAAERGVEEWLQRTRRRQQEQGQEQGPGQGSPAASPPAGGARRQRKPLLEGLPAQLQQSGAARPRSSVGRRGKGGPRSPAAADLPRRERKNALLSPAAPGGGGGAGAAHSAARRSVFGGSTGAARAALAQLGCD